MGTKGIGVREPRTDRWILSCHDGERALPPPRDAATTPTVQEHADLIASIRAGEPIVEIEEVAKSSLTAVMGRFAAYSGKEVTWDFTTKSKLDLMPPKFSLEASLPKNPVPVPGKYPLV